MSSTSGARPAPGPSPGADAARSYEQGFVPAIGAPFATELVAAAGLRQGERVLDVACGTGIVARLAADRVTPGGTVAGLDIDPGMLSVARSVSESAGKAIEWYESSAEAMPLPDASFDVVLCQLGLMFVPDQPRALREMRRVLVPGGRALVSTARPAPMFEAMHDGIARHVGPEAAGFLKKVFSLPDAAWHERRLGDAGFRDVATHIERRTITFPPPAMFLRGYIRSTPLAAAIGRADPEQVAAMEQDVVAAWQPWTTAEGMRSDQELVVASARV